MAMAGDETGHDADVENWATFFVLNIEDLGLAIWTEVLLLNLQVFHALFANQVNLDLIIFSFKR